MITVSSTGNKDVEYSSLEAHVALSVERNRALEIRLTDVERQLASVKGEVRANKLYVIGAAATILAGVLSTIVALIVRFKLG